MDNFKYSDLIPHFFGFNVETREEMLMLGKQGIRSLIRFWRAQARGLVKLIKQDINKTTSKNRKYTVSIYINLLLELEKEADENIPLLPMLRKIDHFSVNQAVISYQTVGNVSLFVVGRLTGNPLSINKKIFLHNFQDEKFYPVTDLRLFEQGAVNYLRQNPLYAKLYIEKSSSVEPLNKEELLRQILK